MTDYDNLINAQDIVRDAAYDARRRTLLTKTINTCETCKGKGHIETAVYHHPTLPDGTQRIEECDECKQTNKAIQGLIDFITDPSHAEEGDNYLSDGEVLDIVIERLTKIK
tara:strand:+ start:193 stop:525 length:333 start_codon:yes stop_codon:yes gene_type:complete